MALRTNGKRSRLGRFETYRDAGGAWRWRLIAGNGAIVADSAESYTRRVDARQAAKRTRDIARTAIQDESDGRKERKRLRELVAGAVLRVRDRVV